MTLSVTITQPSVTSGQGHGTAVAGEFDYETAAPEVIEASWDGHLD